GFPAYGLLDPAIIGDVAGDISVDAGDVSTIAAFVSQLPTPQISAPPTGVTITPVGADPTLSLVAARGGKGETGRGGEGENNSTPPFLPFSPFPTLVSVLLDQPHPQGSTGLTEAILALTYDPAALSVSPADITLGSLPALGTGWQLHSVVD